MSGGILHRRVDNDPGSMGFSDSEILVDLDSDTEYTNTNANNDSNNPDSTNQESGDNSNLTNYVERNIEREDDDAIQILDVRDVHPSTESLVQRINNQRNPSRATSDDNNSSSRRNNRIRNGNNPQRDTRYVPGESIILINSDSDNENENGNGNEDRNINRINTASNVMPNGNIRHRNLSSNRQRRNTSSRSYNSHTENSIRNLMRRNSNTNTADDDIILTGAREVPDVEIVSSGPASETLSPQPQRNGFGLFIPGGTTYISTPNEPISYRGIAHLGIGFIDFIDGPLPVFNNRNFNEEDERRAIARQRQLRRQQERINSRNSGTFDPTRQDDNAQSVEEINSDRHLRSSTRNTNRTRRFGSSRQTLFNNTSAAFSVGIRPFLNGELNDMYDNYRNGQSEAADAIPENIMRVLQNRDEQSENERIANRTKYANEERRKKGKLARIDKKHSKIYTNDIGKEGQQDVCVLCGVELLQGIPEDYNETRKQKADVRHRADVNQLIKQNFRAPYIAINDYSKNEIELSKKIFVAYCGHVYCGRCVNNIMSFKRMTPVERKEEMKREKYTSSVAPNVNFRDYRFLAPLLCVGDSCNKRFMGEPPFVEIYL